jgi:hypothetical protein
MEWIEVTWGGRKRDVYIDDRLAGATGELLTTREGPQKIDLGPDGGYRPRSRRVTVTDTSADDPKVVEFSIT